MDWFEELKIVMTESIIETAVNWPVKQGFIQDGYAKINHLLSLILYVGNAEMEFESWLKLVTMVHKMERDAELIAWVIFPLGFVQIMISMTTPLLYVPLFVAMEWLTDLSSAMTDILA